MYLYFQENDHFIPVRLHPRQVKALIHAKSVTDRIFTKEKPAQNHCQVGNIRLALDTMVQWIEEKSVHKMNIEISLVAKADFEQVGTIFAEENCCHAELVPEIIQIADPIMTQEGFDDVLNDPSKTLFVAEIGEDVVGVALVELRKSIDDPIFRQRRYVHINEIAVATSRRGWGIGRLLMERIHQWGRAQCIAEIELQVWERNEKAIGFYETLGYQMWRRTMRFCL